ncbi:MAG: 2Fe-2S iron-sulfur cluster binding domain-containing protein [Planctomycetes bacterium]|nr:2Fe-2S iron-sulfur cluster binding domain-containing protein [Planctomycetota bacterium]
MNEVFLFLEALPLPLALGALSLVGSLGVLGFTLRWSWRSLRHLDAERARHERSVIAERERVAVLETQAERSWAGYRKFQVVGRTEEDSFGNMATFRIKPFSLPSIDLAVSRATHRIPKQALLELPTFKAGQYLQIRVDLPGEANLLSRCYSLSEVDSGGAYQITVGRVPGAIDPVTHMTYPPGVVSSYLLDRVSERTVLDVTIPQGDFHLNEADLGPAVLVGWGIHAVPLICMFESIARSTSSREAYLFLEITNDDDLHTLLAPILKMAENDPKGRLRIWLSFAHGETNTEKVSRRLPKVSSEEEPETEGRVTFREGRQAVAWIKREVPKHFSTSAEFYVSGAALLLREAKHDLEAWGVSPEKVHFEVFDRESLDAIAEPEASGVSKVTFDVAGKSADWDPDHRNLLGLAASVKVRIPSTCKIGKCGECEVSLVNGRVRYAKDPDWKVKPGHCLPCVATPASATLVLGA